MKFEGLGFPPLDALVVSLPTVVLRAVVLMRDKLAEKGWARALLSPGRSLVIAILEFSLAFLGRMLWVEGEDGLNRVVIEGLLVTDAAAYLLRSRKAACFLRLCGTGEQDDTGNGVRRVTGGRAGRFTLTLRGLPDPGIDIDKSKLVDDGHVLKRATIFEMAMDRVKAADVARMSCAVYPLCCRTQSAPFSSALSALATFRNDESSAPARGNSRYLYGATRHGTRVSPDSSAPATTPRFVDSLHPSFSPWERSDTSSGLSASPDRRDVHWSRNVPSDTKFRASTLPGSPLSVDDDPRNADI